MIVIWAGLLASAIAAEALLILNRGTWSDPSDAIGLGTTFALTYGLAGALVISRRPGNPVGRVFVYIAAVMLVGQLTGEYATYAFLTSHQHLPLRELAGWISQWTFFTAFPIGLSLIFLYFPDGLKGGQKWKLVLVLAVLGCVVLTLGFMLSAGNINPSDRGNRLFVIPYPNPTGLLARGDGGPADVVQTVGWLLSGVALILSVAATLIRLFQERGERREQLKWVAYFAAPVAPAFALHFIDRTFLNGAYPDYTQPIFLGIFLVGIPVAMAIAILKYQLYGIDVVISRTLVYGALAALITAVYVGIVVGVGTLVGSGDRPNLVLSIIATAVVAVAFQPVRERLQKIANRLVYGKRATPYEVLSEFSSRVAESYAGEQVLARMARVLAEGTGAQQADVWLRSAGNLRPAAAWPEFANGHARESLAITGQILPQVLGADRTVPVRHQGELLGALSVRKRSGESLTPIEEKLLEDLAHQAGLVLKNVGLTADLQARLEDLRASRQRLVAAQDQERRRLERNLHDGAQQHLVALKVKLGLAEILVVKDPAKAKATIQQLKLDADEALETLRDLARGIYPPLLADRGLVAALEAQARKATVPVTVEADGVQRYPQETEAAVYFCVLEALQNVQKYASAGAASVALRDLGGELTFEVVDDGPGFDPSTIARGSGLTNMADRLDALGGSLEVEGSPGKGAAVRGRLPLQAAV